MKSVALFLVADAACITCAVFAGLIALKGLDGWLWFLGAAVLLTASVKSTRSTDCECGKEKRDA